MPSLQSFRITQGSKLTQSFDLEERLRDATSADTLKGMFFQQLLDLAKASNLHVETPGQKIYRAFLDYPVADYYRLIHGVSRRLYPNVTNAEAMRRTALLDFQRFAESTVGRVMLSFAGDARAAMLKADTLYGAVLKGSAKVTGKETQNGGVRLEYRSFPSLVDLYPIGTIEGLCRHYRADYEIDVEVLSARDADYVVRFQR